MEVVEVDGSQGEGGGQILRAAAAFSAILRQPVKVTGIRAGRDPPGLKRQHASALNVIAEVFGGELKGAHEGSSVITLSPGKPRGGSFAMDTGTAASVTLLLQAVVPAAALSGVGLTLDLVGGTDVPWSPTLDYFSEVACVGYSAVGIKAAATASRRGYYPRGGGVVRASIEPCASLRSLTLLGPYPRPKAMIISRCGGLPVQVADRQLSAAVGVIEAAGVEVTGRRVAVEESGSPGTSVLVRSAGGEATLGGDAIGARGKRAEEVGAEAARRFLRAAASGAAFDSNLADMIIPLLSLADSPSRVRVPEVTPHLDTGLRVASQFTSCRWSVEQGVGSAVVTVEPEKAPTGGKRQVLSTWRLESVIRRAV